MSHETTDEKYIYELQNYIFDLENLVHQLAMEKMDLVLENASLREKLDEIDGKAWHAENGAVYPAPPKGMLT